MMSVPRSLMCHGRIVILQNPLNLSSHRVLSVSYAINTAYRVRFSSKRVFAIISRWSALHAPQQRSLHAQRPWSSQTAQTNTSHSKTPHIKKIKQTKKTLAQRLPTVPSHAIPETPPYMWRNGCHVSREIKSAPRSTPAEKDTTSHKGLGRVPPVRHPGSPKKAFAALSPGSWVTGCIRHCAILESNAGTVSWVCNRFVTFLNFFGT